MTKTSLDQNTQEIHVIDLANKHVLLSEKAPEKEISKDPKFDRLKCNSSPDEKIPLFYIIQTVFYIIQYTQSHGVNMFSFGVIKLQNPNLHLSSYTPPLSQPFNP